MWGVCPKQQPGDVPGGGKWVKNINTTAGKRERERFQPQRSEVFTGGEKGECRGGVAAAGCEEKVRENGV